MDECFQENVRSVQEWQRFYGMNPREDSRLTKLYAEGSLNMRADEVARELVATHFIFQHTLYGELIEEFMRLVACRLRTEYELQWSSTWEITRCYAPIALKLMCVESAGIRIPPCLNEISLECSVDAHENSQTFEDASVSES